MNIGTTLNQVEKKFGPALPGVGRPETTFSAIRYHDGKGKKFAGLPGRQEGAEFYIHFPIEVDWNKLAIKNKGIPDFINDLKPSGPQGEQGREAKVAHFLEGIRSIQNEKDQKKKLADLKGEHLVAFAVNGEQFKSKGTITVDKKGKVTLKIVI